MIINSPLCITHYAGQTPLNLTGQPVNLTPDQLIDFNKLLQSVGTIYASQNSSTNVVPTFWTKLSGVQNGGKIYQPDPSSTLGSLQPRQSYYFIMRDSAQLPINIPAVGGPLEGFIDDIQNLPSIKIIPSTASSPFNETNDTYSFSISITGLQSYKNYTYSIDVIDAEWPTYFVGRPSGALTTGKNVSDTIADVSSIPNKLVFCGSGICDSYPEILNPYTSPNHPFLWGSNIDYRVVIRASLRCNDCLNDNTVYSDYVILKYDTPNPNLTLPSIQIIPATLQPSNPVAMSYPSASISSATSNQTLISPPTQNLQSNNIDTQAIVANSFNETNNTYSFNLSVTGLQPHKHYTYSVDVIDAEWPTYFVGKPSGTLTTGQNTTDAIEDIASVTNRLVFCVSGVCDSYQDILNPYMIPDYPILWRSSIDYRVIIRASLTCNDCLNNNTVYSDYIIVKYATSNPNTTPSLPNVGFKITE